MSLIDSGTVAITGMPRPVGVKELTKTIPYAPGMPLRYEISAVYSAINDEASTPPNQDLLRMQWTLFILALEKFKAMPVDDKLSYFRIAGIHGYPHASWDGVTKPEPDPEQGYCHHNDIAYVQNQITPIELVAEGLQFSDLASTQCIWLYMQSVIAEWVHSGILDSSQVDIWYDAAKTWRLYYWDWGYNARLPEAMKPAMISIWLPDGRGNPTHKRDDQPNPLTGFANPEKDSNGNPLPFGQMPEDKKHFNIKAHQNYPWDKCSGVSRYGLTSVEPSLEELNGINNFDVACGEMDKMSQLWYKPRGPQIEAQTPNCPLGDALNRMFSMKWNKTWGSFASTKWNSEYELDTDLGYMSLEYIHNNVHNICGGSKFLSEGGAGVGHMSDVPVAAFDPLFWFHHCNIDRLLAMWQILHWDLWWDDAPQPITHANKRDILSTDPLLPFHTKENVDPDGDFWTSEMARNWTSWNYQYSDLLPSANSILNDGTLNENLYIQEMQSYVNELYRGTDRVVFDVFNDSSVENSRFFGQQGATRKWEDAAWPDYIINIRYDRYASDGASYAIEFYLCGNSSLAGPEHFVGEVYAYGGMSSGDKGGCGNCKAQRNAKILSKGQIPLTIPLINQARSQEREFENINSIKTEEVQEYLRKHLRWKFIKSGGQEAPASEFPATKVSVWTGTGRPTLMHGKWQPPTYTDYRPLWEATEDKEGGLQKDDHMLGEANFVNPNDRPDLFRYSAKL